MKTQLTRAKESAKDYTRLCTIAESIEKSEFYDEYLTDICVKFLKEIHREIEIKRKNANLYYQKLMQ